MDEEIEVTLTLIRSTKNNYVYEDTDGETWPYQIYFKKDSLPDDPPKTLIATIRQG